MNFGKIAQGAWSAICPFAVVLTLLFGMAAFSSNMNLGELALGAVVVSIITGGLLSIPVIVYHFASKRSKLLAVAFYCVLIFGLSWSVYPGLRWELGYDGYIKVILVGLLVYGGTAIWTLSRPTFVRMLPSAILSLIVLVLLFR